MYLHLVLSRNTLTSGIIFNVLLYCKNLLFLLSIPILVFTDGCWKHVLSIFFFFYLQVHTRLNTAQKLGFLYCTPQSVQPMCSPEGLRMLLRLWWWFLISFLVEYKNILPSQDVYCCEITHWKPYFFVSRLNWWYCFVFWKLGLSPVGKKKITFAFEI